MKILIFDKEISLFTCFYVGFLYCVIICSLCWGTIDFKGFTENITEGFNQNQGKVCTECGKCSGKHEDKTKFIQNKYIYDTPTHPLNENNLNI